MSTVVPLSVLAPALSYKAVAGSFASLEDMVNIRIPPVLYPDGSVVQPDELRGGFAQLSRLATAGPGSELGAQGQGSRDAARDRHTLRRGSLCGQREEPLPIVRRVEPRE